MFHAFAWLALAYGALEAPRWSGGIGWPLAALHAITLGVLAMSAIGASLQLVPVATRQGLLSHRAVALLWWLYAPGVAVLVLAMAWQQPLWIALAALPVVSALLLYGALLARNLVGARGMPGVLAMGWLAVAALAVALASAAAMVATWTGWAAWPRHGLLMLHIVCAVFGFMGLLALGLSNILVPMFTLGSVPADKIQFGIAALAATALLAAVPVAFGAWPQAALLVAVACALAAALWHIVSMRAVMRAGMRRELGGSFQLVRLGWAGLLATLVLAAWWALEPDRAGLLTALVACAVAGWLLSFLFGILQRIVPFLVSMHLAGTIRRAPAPSALTHERALAVHRVCHGVALALLALAIGFDSASLALVAAAVGGAGALAFALFFVVVVRRVVQTRAAAAAARAAGPR
ncbi:MAG: hypothetical protein HS128_09280 [Ideonella sp.]|nr:hypothetical protein [Ideonella sp.]MCC7456481.1 hypothetical protein [Nitrospira sp.]